MALIGCPDCSEPVSDKAQACLKCGCPIPGAPDEVITVALGSGRTGELIGMVMMAAGVVAGIAGCSGLCEILLVAGFVVFLAGRFS